MDLFQLSLIAVLMLAGVTCFSLALHRKNKKHPCFDEIVKDSGFKFRYFS